MNAYSPSLFSFLSSSHIIAWGIPLAFSAAAAVLGGIGSETTPTCFIIREWSNELLFYPLGVFVYGATFLFGWTLLFIAKLSCQAEQGE